MQASMTTSTYSTASTERHGRKEGKRERIRTEVDDKWDESKVDNSLDDFSDLEDGFLGFVLHDAESM